MIVAIDGPAGSGKSTIAKLIAEQSGFIYVNSGRLYRSITYWAIQKLIQDNREMIEQGLPSLEIEYLDSSILLNGQDLDRELHSDVVDSWVARVSSIPLVRDLVNGILLEQSQKNNIVVEGRDMATVVFPFAEVKWYLDASIEARAQRRFQQGTSELGIEQIRVALAQRDTIDKEKQIGSLRIAEDACYLDTSDLTIGAVCAKVLQSIQGHNTTQE